MKRRGWGPSWLKSRRLIVRNRELVVREYGITGVEILGMIWKSIVVTRVLEADRESLEIGAKMEEEGTSSRLLKSH